MKKLLIFTIALAMLTSVVQAQAPTALMIGGLYQGGQRDLGVWAGASTVAVQDTSLGVKDIIRFGYFYANSSPDEVQAISVLNLIEKTMLELKPGWTWYVSTGAGTFIEIAEGEDNTNFAILFETGIQVTDVVKLGIGLHYEAIMGQDNRKFPYLLINLFP